MGGGGEWGWAGVQVNLWEVEGAVGCTRTDFNKVIGMSHQYRCLSLRLVSGPLQLDNNSKDNNSTQEFLRPLGLSCKYCFCVSTACV